MTEREATLHFISGRLASGKTTLARRLADQEGVVLICEDVWLAKLSDGISSFEDYLKWSRRCRSVIGPLVIQILRAGTSVVFDFAGNTQAERTWVRSLFEEAQVKHVLHYLGYGNDSRQNGPFGLGAIEVAIPKVTRESKSAAAVHCMVIFH
jgi:predicted kinase